MGKVSTGLSMSLDGFIAGPNEDLGHRWVTVVSGSSHGTPAATPNTNCRALRWCSGSRPRAPSFFGRYTARWERS